METCLLGTALALFILTSVGITEWVRISVVALSANGMTQVTLWNLTTSSIASLIWLNLPLIWLAHRRGWRLLRRVLSTSTLILLGPVLLGLNLLGSYLQAIDYSSDCVEFCVSAR